MRLPKEFTSLTRRSKFVVLCLIIALPLAGFYIGLHYRQPIVNVNRASRCIQQITPTPTPTNALERTGIISDGTPQIMRDVVYRVPSGWWYRQTANPFYGDNWAGIHPKQPSGEATTFVLKAVTGKFEPRLNLKYLSVTSQEEIIGSNYTGHLVTGLATPPSGPDITCGECYLSGYQPGDTVAITTIAFGYNYYTFEGNISVYEDEYREILSSFVFSEHE